MHIQKELETIDACRYCFMCRHVCTMAAATGWESDTPRGKGLVLFQILKGHAGFSDDLVKTIYRCCLCGMCRSWCVGGYDMPAAILAARRDVVDQGREPAGARAIRAGIMDAGNPFGLPPEDRLKAVRNGGGFRDQGEVLYYLGCDTAYHQPEIARAFVRILLHAGVDFALLENETSSGKPLTVLGYGREAEEVARKLAGRIRATGCRTLVTTCPSSYDAFKNDYPAMGAGLDGIEVLHATEYAARLLDRGAVSPKTALRRSATPHDSDYLCRYNGLSGQLRRVLGSIPELSLREMGWTREKAHSCGEAGGVLPLMSPDLGRQLAHRLLGEAACTGADLLVTTCPVTKRALVAANETGMEIRDVMELFSDSLGSRQAG